MKQNNIQNAKRKGAAGEAQFAADALSRGLNVLQPYGDFLSYDLIVENSEGKVFRVQVKTTAHKQKGKTNTYRVTAARGNKRIGKNKLTSRDTDILAVYVVPVKTWYHIPVENVTCAAVHMRPTEKSSAQYEVWKEAWNVYYKK